jgi:hypothetical protein
MRDMGLSLLKIRTGAGCGHNVPRQGLEFECAFAIPAHLEELCGAAMCELEHREGLRTGSRIADMPGTGGCRGGMDDDN